MRIYILMLSVICNVVYLSNIFLLLASFVAVIHSQEGWRLEHEKPTDKTSPIIFKGVVYNEMKGAFVSDVLCEYLINRVKTYSDVFITLK